MRKLHLILLILLLFVSDAISENSTCLRLIQTIPMPSVIGRIDHMAIDLEGQRLFVAPLGNNSLEVLDSHSFKHIRRIGGLNEPQGVLYILEFGKIFVTNGGMAPARYLIANHFNLLIF